MNVSFRTRFLAGIVGSLVAVQCAHAETISVDTLGVVPAGSPVVPGQWNAGYSQTRAYAFANGIPMVVVWSNPGCGHCFKFDQMLISQKFKDWAKDSPYVFHYKKGDQNSDTFKWCYQNKNWVGLASNQTKYFPYILLYWQKSDGRVVVEQRHLGDKLRGSGNIEAQAENVIRTIEEVFKDYVANDKWDPGDDTRTGAQTLGVSKTWQSQEHSLKVSDTNDWFKFTAMAHSTNLVSFADVQGAPQYQFFNEMTQTANGTVTGTSNFQFANPSGTATNVYMRIFGSGANLDIKYTIKYKEYVPVTVGFESTNVTFNAASGTFEIPVVRGGDDAALKATAEVTVAAEGVGPLLAPLFTLGTSSLNWAGTTNDETNLVFTVDPTSAWLGTQTFKLKLSAVNSEALAPFGEVTVTLNPGQPKTGTIGYTGYVVNGVTNNYSSSARPVVREGDTVTVLVSRTGGSNTVATAGFKWGSADSGATASWADAEDGVRSVDITVPTSATFQATRTLGLQISPVTGASAAAKIPTLTFTISNEFYAGPLADFAKQNPTLPFTTASDAWFLSDGGNLRSKPLENNATAVMTATVTGPGVLKLAADPAGGASVKLTVKGVTKTVTVDGAVYGYLIPEGKQTVTVTATGVGATSYAQLSDLAYVSLTAAVTAIAPRTGDVVRQASAVRLSWNASSVGLLTGISGITNSFIVSVGPAEKNLTQLAELDTGSSYYEMPVATPGSFVWRVAIKVSDGTTVIPFNGAAQTFSIVGLNAPSVTGDTTDPAFDAYTATLTASTYAGLKTDFGPLAVQNADNLKVKSGSLPAGMSLTKDAVGNWWVSGVPTKTANGARVVLQAVQGKTVGTTLALDYTVLPLPREAFGNYNGWVTFSPDGTDVAYGTATLTVSAAGKITGKLILPSKTYSLAATGYDALTAEGFCLTNGLVAKAKNESYPMAFYVSTNAPGAALLLSESGVFPQIVANLNRDGWTDKEGLTDGRDAALRLALNYAAPNLSKASAGYYTMVLSSTNNMLAGSGYLTITIDKKGNVKAAGKLADGTAVSMSSVLLVDEATGTPGLSFATAPKAYSGGFFAVWTTSFAYEAIAPGRIQLFGEGLWESSNTKAPFSIGLDAAGGWYPQNAKLTEMYTWPEAATSTNWFATASAWEGEGYGIWVNPNAKGTGFNALPKSGPENPKGLKLSVVAKTGLFSGSFTEVVGNKSVTRKVMGVLTPALPNVSDGLGIAGAGFYLVPQNQSGKFELEVNCGCGP